MLVDLHSRGNSQSFAELSVSQMRVAVPWVICNSSFDKFNYT